MAAAASAALAKIARPGVYPEANIPNGFMAWFGVPATVLGPGDWPPERRALALQAARAALPAGSAVATDEDLGLGEFWGGFAWSAVAAPIKCGSYKEAVAR
jgi:hypothetical protein